MNTTRTDNSFDATNTTTVALRAADARRAVPASSAVAPGATQVASWSTQRQPSIARPVALRMSEVSKSYGRGQDSFVALRDVSVDIEAGTFTALMGPSGSGKSTFMHCAAGLDRPTSGEVQIAGTPITGMNETDLTRFRRSHVGFVFQSYNLLPGLTVRENIVLPARLSGMRLDRGWVRSVGERMGLADHMRHRPAQLSGGQQQRVAIARALVARPDVIFADEPTGALDTSSGREVLGLLAECVRYDGLTVVMVTHDPAAAAHAESVLILADGCLVDRLTDPTAEQISSRMLTIGARR